MAGTFVPGERKTRPGMYMRNVSEAKKLLGLSERGIVIMPLLSANYGPDNFFEINIDDLDAQYSKLGYHMTDDKALILREMFKAANKVVLKRLSGGNKANATIGNLLTTAKYSGTDGNNLKIVISDSQISNKLVQIFWCVDTKEDKIFEADTIENVEELPINDWVDFSGTGALTDSTGLNLTGGTTTAESATELQKFLDDSETQEFNVMYLPSVDSTYINAADAKIKYFINNVGKQVTLVRPHSTVDGDYEYITTVSNGVILDDGTVLDSLQTSAWVAAASAAAYPYQALTSVNYPGAVDTNPRLKHDEVVRGLKNGLLMFTFDAGKAKVEQDINSLTTITADNDESYKKNRVIRTLMEIQILSSKVLIPGRYNGNEDGYSLIEQELYTSVLEFLQGLNALKNVDTESDIIRDVKNTKGDEYYATFHVQPVDSIDKFYVTVKNSY